MRNIILDIEKILEDMKFKPSDAKIYSLLLAKGEMRVSEIAKELGLSARFVRDRLKDLSQKGIVKREVVKKGWIGYVYMAENPITVLRKLKSKIIKEIENLEKMLE
ncbi:MAG: transcriptional regulator [Thaumarchaeota archaeon]|nr:MAG: transcriptional regulator [Nitrososphaerota archaeon]